GGGQSRADSGRPAVGESIPSDRPTHPAEQQAAPANGFPPPAGSSAAGESQSAEDRRVRELLAAEVARLASEREAIQARWNAASEQLQRQIAALHDEAAQLAREREALAGARSGFLEERNVENRELADRSARLAELQAKLAAATSALNARLLEAQQPREPVAASEPPALDVTDLLAAEMAPTAIVTGITHDLQDELARSPAQVQQVMAEVTWEQAVAFPDNSVQSALAHEQQTASQPAQLPTAPQQSLQAQWEETSERLRVQIEQLQAESAELTNQRLALKQSRQDWQGEGQGLARQPAARGGQMAPL